MKPPRRYLPKDLLPSFVLLIVECLKAAHFVFGSRQKGEVFSKVAHEIAGLPETGFGSRTKESCGHFMKSIWIGGPVVRKATAAAICTS